MIESHNLPSKHLNDSPWQTNQSDEWELLFRQCPQKTFNQDSIIYSQGELPEFVYFLTRGRVKASHIGEDGNEKTIMIFAEGSIFGEAASIERVPSLLTTTAITTSHLLYMHRNEFLEKVFYNPRLSQLLAYHLTNIIRVLTHHINDVTFMNAEERVISYLIKLSKIFGESTDQGIKITLKFTHQQIAELIGTSRVTVSKVMSFLDKEGIIKKIDGYLYISKMDHLKESVKNYS